MITPYSSTTVPQYLIILVSAGPTFILAPSLGEEPGWQSMEKELL